ncbi:helix-turn-helix domain-containing protein [Allopusillimonas ginsengisoli]|uniref:helix-turn-helix domain-containing protein n=1 Tax=Allopusillimonas ginsengisoli TaxID=453575 RepID=UPI0010C1BA3C|nr:hypothetical protein D7I39_09055 [Allopusillimonas ginsengisoli]
MREHLDCAVFGTLCTDSWFSSWLGPQAGGRVHIHRLCDSVDIADPSSLNVLQSCGIRLHRYDACLIPVTETNLAWARTMLAGLGNALRTPVVVMARGLRAAALNDLCSLGANDFVQESACFEELRVRVERLLEARRPAMSLGRAVSSVREYPLSYAVVPAMNGSGHGLVSYPSADNEHDFGSAELDAFARASASYCSVTKESFRMAKSRVIERFEKVYIAAALSRHSGNIAMAARAVQKHRRAFWALMRKHDIDARPFRNGPKPFPAHGGKITSLAYKDRRDCSSPQK